MSCPEYYEMTQIHRKLPFRGYVSVSVPGLNVNFEEYIEWVQWVHVSKRKGKSPIETDLRNSKCLL